MVEPSHLCHPGGRSIVSPSYPDTFVTQERIVPRGRSRLGRFSTEKMFEKTKFVKNNFLLSVSKGRLHLIYLGKILD